MLVSQLEHGDYFRHPTGALCRRSGARLYVCVDGAQCGGDLTGDTAVEPVTIMDAAEVQALVDAVLEKAAAHLHDIAEAYKPIREKAMEDGHTADATDLNRSLMEFEAAAFRIRELTAHPL